MCVCMPGAAIVERVLRSLSLSLCFSISHTSVKGRSSACRGQASFRENLWLSIMYNRDTSASRWDVCLPFTCLVFRSAEYLLPFVSSRACTDAAVFQVCRARIHRATVLLWTPHASLLFMLSLTVGRDGCVSSTYRNVIEEGSYFFVSQRWTLPFLFHRSTRRRCDLLYFFSRTICKDIGAFSFSSLFLQTLSY